MTQHKMSKSYLLRKQTCSFMVNLEMLIIAEESKGFDVKFDIDIDEPTQLAIITGIKKAIECSELPSHKFRVSNIIEHWENAPPMGFDMCAQGATKLALGLSKLNATYPWGNSVKEKASEEISNKNKNET